MLRALVLLSVLTTSSMAHAWGPIRTSLTKPSKPTTQGWQWPVNYRATVQETFYGVNVGGSFSFVPPGYVRVLTYCRGFSTNLKNMLNRALNSNDETYTLRRLTCATKGLGVDLLNYRIDDLTVYEKAHQINNHTALKYLDSL